MSRQLDQRLNETGTRFQLFPQPRYLTDKDGNPLFKPEVVTVSVPPEEIQPGPADDRMYVVDAVGKLPYEPREGPPWSGPFRPKLKPGPDGHFDTVDIGSPDFSAATMYATVRRVLDIWEDYFGHQMEWEFLTTFARMELIPRVEWDNAQSGFGFLEFGFGRTESGQPDHDRPYCENFDVLAHELGHAIINSLVGHPENPADDAVDYDGFQECSGDITAIVALLHFDSFVSSLLNQTDGNLLTVNGLDRVGELSNTRQIRVAFNAKRMSDVDDEPHNHSLPLTGALFDTMVEIFQEKLVQGGMITDDLRRRSTNTPAGDPDLAQIDKEFRAAYAGNERAFTVALLEARDDFGRLLAGAWALISPNFLSYHGVLRALVRVDQQITGGANADILRDSFGWRQIGPGPASPAMRPHRLEDCGLRAPEPRTAATRLV